MDTIENRNKNNVQCMYRVVAKAGRCGILCDELFLVGSKCVVARTAPQSAIPDTTRIFDSFWLLFVVYTLAGQAKHDAVVLPLGGNV